MRNVKLENGYLTTNLDLAGAMLCVDGMSLDGIGGEGKEKEFRIKGDPKALEEIKEKWFTGRPVVDDLKRFAEKRRSLRALIP
jgi:hypothetical protein